MKMCCGPLLALCFCTAVPLTAAYSASGDRPLKEISAFNDTLRMATRTMNNEATLALWEENGITLLPDTPPIVGRPAIVRYLNDITTQLGPVRMRQFDLNCFDILVTGSWATEWCTEHQIVDLGKDKPPFEGYGKLLLVLHRGRDKQWRLTREMWNRGVPGP